MSSGKRLKDKMKGTQPWNPNKSFINQDTMLDLYSNHSVFIILCSNNNSPWTNMCPPQDSSSDEKEEKDRKKTG